MKSGGMMRIVILLYLFLLTALASLALVPIVKHLAFRFNILDQPGGRKIHTVPTPYLGGAAIFISFSCVILFNLLVLYLLSGWGESNALYGYLISKAPLVKQALPKLTAVLIGGSVVFITGLCDDIGGARFSIHWKMLGQIVAAAFAVMMGVRIECMPWQWMDMAVSIFWIFLITNAFNLLDNMDGLSAGVACIAALIFFIVAFVQGQFFMTAVLAVFIGSLLGLLRYNFPPASIFMGDAGSQFIGFILGTLTITTSYVTPISTSLLPVLMPLLILSIPLFDTLSVVMIRISEKRPIYIGDRCHLSHRLVNMGFTGRGAVIFIYLLTLITGLAAILLPSLRIIDSILIFIHTVSVLIMVSIIMYIAGRKKG
jgi:UDP-GlcNAc:undecaprenyl-phosphate GlcNAc-1-phosphate transferase